MSFKNPYLNELMEKVIKRNAGETEFHQAATEILESLGTDVHSARDGDIAVLSDGKSVWVE